MYLRFFGRLLDANNAVLYAAPFPLDSGSVSLFLAAFAADMTPGASVLLNSFEVDDVYPDRYTRLAATTRTAADIGKIYHQQSDDSYWKLTAIGPPATYDGFVPAAPALPGPAAGGGGGGGGVAPAKPAILITAQITGYGPNGDPQTNGPGSGLNFTVLNADGTPLDWTPYANIYFFKSAAPPVLDAVGGPKNNVPNAGFFTLQQPHTGSGGFYSDTGGDSYYWVEGDKADNSGTIAGVSNIVHIKGGAIIP